MNTAVFIFSTCFSTEQGFVADYWGNKCCFQKQVSHVYLLQDCMNESEQITITPKYLLSIFLNIQCS